MFSHFVILRFVAVRFFTLFALQTIVFFSDCSSSQKTSAMPRFSGALSCHRIVFYAPASPEPERYPLGYLFFCVSSALKVKQKVVEKFLFLCYIKVVRV